jgi:SecD/SecF fusion protein
MTKRESEMMRIGRAVLLALTAATWLFAASAVSQEPGSERPAASTETDTDTPAKAENKATSEEVTADSTDEAAPAGEATDGKTDSDVVQEDEDAESSDLPAGKSEPSIASKAIQQTGTTVDKGWSPWFVAMILIALFVLPIMAGNYFARLWNMPDHGWKFAVVLGALGASILICTFGEFKFGPDLAGGITLVYELANVEETPASDVSATGAKAGADGLIRSGGREFERRELIGALKRRLDPDGTKEITIREYGPAIEIIIPQTGPDEMESVKRKITDLGQLEFRITADPALPKDRPIIEQAKRLPPGQKSVSLGGNKVAEWVAYDIEAFGPVDEEGMIVKRQAGDTAEALVLMDPMNVTGEYLTSATKGLDDRGGPAVHFSFDAEGARRFRQLTSQNKPNPATPNVYRNLGVILDKTLKTAPRIETTISDRGMISGGSMTEKEVDHYVDILNAGSLPAALNKTPISEEIISPTLGKVTVDKGKIAIAVSMAAIVLFMIVYYQFSGLVACLALTFNLLLVLALMVLIKAAFTLPGLAGLVLTIGMAVDANILIYERLREELKAGTALRMAIRNGFSRAMSAIIDSNVTTIITGIVLFYLGTDQVKGFAVTLILGLLTSMFTAIFFARVVFDVAERRGWISNLHMMKILAQPNYDFLRARWVAIGASLVLVLIGAVAAFDRGRQLFDIDFTGGSSVTFTLTEPVSIAEVTEALEETPLADKNLLVVARGTTNMRYTVDSSEQSVEAVQKTLVETFGDRLMRYSLEFSDLAPYSEGGFSGTQAKVRINAGPGYAPEDGVSYAALREWLQKFLAEAGHEGIQPALSNPNFRPGSSARFKEWDVRLAEVNPEAAKPVLDRLQAEMASTPLFPMANKIGGRVSETMQQNALLAVFVSLVSVVIYLWLRFQKVSYGMAAAIAVAHDVLVTIGVMALSAYVVRAVPGLASMLQLEAFQINLTIVAALLTIIGYSLNDTIVTFDRLREIKGKSPQLTSQMVNASVNQCLSRTILTALTVFMTVVILYFFGGEGIHSFAFAFLVGVIAGTYSTVYIAAPVLLWLSGTTAASTELDSPRAA